MILATIIIMGLVIKFNSFRKTSMVLLTIPLAGIVINNAINN